MVELQAAERRELAGIILDLLREFPSPGIGLADVGVARELGRVQGGSKRHLQSYLALGPLSRIG